jgi:hypothetical protein
MKLKFTYHAQFHLSYDRGHPTDNIKQTILYPDFENLLSDGRIVSEKKVENNVLRVIYTRDRNKYVILSFYYLNK